MAKTQKAMAWTIMRSPERRVGGDIGRQRGFPAVAVREQLVLVVERLLAGLGRELEVRALDDRIHRAGLLAEAAIDALGHVDVVPRGAAAAVGAGLGLDRDGQGRADRLAELAGDAAFLAVGIPPQSMLAAEPWADRSPLIGVVDRDPFLEEIAEGQGHSADQFL